MTVKFKSSLYGLFDPLPYTGKEIENPFPNPISTCEPKWDEKNLLWTFSAKLGDCGIYSSEENNQLIFEKRIWHENNIVTFKCVYGTDILVREIPPDKIDMTLEVSGKTVSSRGSMAPRFSMLFFSKVRFKSDIVWFVKTLTTKSGLVRLLILAIRKELIKSYARA